MEISAWQVFLIPVSVESFCTTTKKKHHHTITSNYLHENRPSLCGNEKRRDPKVIIRAVENTLCTFAELTGEDTCATTNTAASKHATFIQPLL